MGLSHVPYHFYSSHFNQRTCSSHGTQVKRNLIYKSTSGFCRVSFVKFSFADYQDLSDFELSACDQTRMSRIRKGFPMPKKNVSIETQTWIVRSTKCWKRRSSFDGLMNILKHKRVCKIRHPFGETTQQSQLYWVGENDSDSLQRL